MIEHSTELKDLATALAKAQASVKGAVKDSTNPAFRSKYADLESVWDACRKPLTDNGLSVSQWPGRDEVGAATLTTMLLHSSGQWIKGTASTALSKNDAQGVGSALTYLRRYALAAVASVAPEDDDGNAASHERSGGAAVPRVQTATGASAVGAPPASGPVTLTSVVGFGKHKGKTVKEVGPDYFEWIMGEARKENHLERPTAVFAAGALKALMPDMDQMPPALMGTDEEERALDARLSGSPVGKNPAKAGAR